METLLSLCQREATLLELRPALLFYPNANLRILKRYRHYSGDVDFSLLKRRGSVKVETMFSYFTQTWSLKLRCNLELMRDATLNC